MTDSWPTLPLDKLRVFVIDYAGYAARTARGSQSGAGRLSPEDFFPIWEQRTNDEECTHCRIG